MSKFTASIDFVKHGWANGSLIVRTTNNVEFQSDRFGDIEIPAGTLSDGASVPRMFWAIFSPFDGDYFDSAILHDMLYRDRTTKLTRAQVDLLFLEAMESLGVGWIKRTLVYRAVRLGGGKPWNNARKC